MKTFVLYYESGDTCGNSDRYLVGYFNAETIEEARERFPKGLFCGFEVEELQISSAVDLKRKAKKNKEAGLYY